VVVVAMSPQQTRLVCPQLGYSPITRMALLCSVAFHWPIYESLYVSTHNFQQVAPGQAIVPNDDIITTPSPPSPSSAIPEYDVQA